MLFTTVPESTLVKSLAKLSIQPSHTVLHLPTPPPVQEEREVRYGIYQEAGELVPDYSEQWKAYRRLPDCGDGDFHARPEEDREAEPEGTLEVCVRI